MGNRPPFDMGWEMQIAMAQELGGSPADYYLGKPETKAAAEKLGWGPELERLQSQTAQLTPIISRTLERAQARAEQVTELGAPSEDRLALDFVEQHGHGFRYVAGWNCWLRYTGGRWQRDDTWMVYQLIRDMVRVRVAGTKAERSTAAASYIAGVERLARTDQRIVIVPSQLDADPMILNTQSGIVDLRTGEQRPHDAAALCSKITTAGVDPAHGPILLDEFLQGITRGDVELRQYLQRFLGYCATGLTSEDVLGFWYGIGGNGKGSLAEAVAYALGDYARAFAPDVLLEAKGERHPTDLAQFQGVRFAYTSEPATGAAWNDSRVKSLTGDTTISARFMRADFFTFDRTHKTLVLGNSQPTLAEVSHAIKRRFQMVPFRAVFTQTPGPGMRERLKAEASGALLAWIVAGAREWLAQGTRPPDSVTTATAEYLSDQDVIGQWLSEHCERDPDATELLADLFKDYRAWCDLQGHRPKGNRGLSAQLVGLGFRKSHTMLGRAFEGLRLRGALNQ